MTNNTALGLLLVGLLQCSSVGAGAPAAVTQEVTSSGIIENISTGRKQLVIDGKRYRMASREIRLNARDEQIQFRNLYVGSLVDFVIAPQQGSSDLPAIQSLRLILQ